MVLPPAPARRLRATLLLLLLAAGALPGMAGGRGAAGPLSKAESGRALQGQAYQARLGKVRERLRARLAARAPAGPVRGAPAPGPATPEPPAQPRPEAPPPAWELGPPARPSPWVRLLFLLMALFSALPADAVQPGPPRPDLQPWDFQAWAGGLQAELVLPAVPLDLQVEAAVRLDASPGAVDGQAFLGEAFHLARTLDRADRQPFPDLSQLVDRLAQFEPWAQRAASQARRTGAQAEAASLATLAALAADLRGLAEARQAGQVTAAEAEALLAVAGSTVLTVATAFWVEGQEAALATFPPLLERVRGQMAEARDQAANRTAGAGAARMAPPLRVPRELAAARKACCAYYEQLAQVGIRRVLGASGEASVAATVLFLEATAVTLGVDLQALGNLTWSEPDPALLGATRLTPAAAAALAPAGGAVAPQSLPAGDWPDPATAPRCASFACDDPLLALQAGSAGEFLTAGLTYVAASTLYVTAAQIGLAAAGPPPMPDPDLLGPLRRAAAGVTGAASGPSAEALAVFAPVPTGLSDPDLLAGVLGTLARELQARGLPDLEAAPPADLLAGSLDGLRDLLAAGLARRADAVAGTATAGSAWAWDRLAWMAECAWHAAAGHRAWHAGTLDGARAAALLTVAADTLELVGLGIFMVPSAVPVVQTEAWLRAVQPELAKARARALGVEPPAPGGPRCAACCSLANLGNQEWALATAWEAGRVNLAAYLESVIGAGIGTGLAAADLAQAVRAAAPARDPDAVTPQSVPADVPSGPPAGCAGCPCDTAFSDLQVAQAGELLTAARLNLAGTTLFLLLRGLRVAALLERGS